MITTAVFDLDGTLADTIPLTLYSLKEVTREMTGRVLGEEEILSHFGPPDTEIIKTLVGRKELEAEAVERYARHFKEHFQAFIKPIDGIREMLDFIKSKGIKTGLFTGRSLRMTEIILEELRMPQDFSVIISGEDTKSPKPDPEGIIKSLQLLGSSPEESIYTGDFEVDILASRAAGVTSVLALWSPSASMELITKKPDVYFKRVRDFVSWLKEEI